MQTSVPTYSLIYFNGQVKASCVRCRQWGLYIKKVFFPRDCIKTMSDGYTILEDFRKGLPLSRLMTFCFGKTLIKLS